VADPQRGEGAVGAITPKPVYMYNEHSAKKLGKFYGFVGRSRAKKLSVQLQGLCPLNPHQGLCPWTPLGAPPQTPVIGSRSARSPWPLPSNKNLWVCPWLGWVLRRNFEDCCSGF